MAEEWADAARPSMPATFCYFDADKYRWGRSIIERGAEGYVVKGDRRRHQVANLSEAAQAAGVSLRNLSHWVELAKLNQVYCMEADSDGTIEIMLAGSEWSPYGFRYARMGSDVALETLWYYVAQGGMENTDLRMDHITGRWFYFEARR